MKETLYFLLVARGGRTGEAVRERRFLGLLIKILPCAFLEAVLESVLEPPDYLPELAGHSL